jgi:beta-N-acetylhexosaminidase
MSLGPIMLDIDAYSLTPADRELLREPAVGGVVLFSRNYRDPSQLIDLVGEIRALRRPPLLVAVDHEGGRVQRFRDGFTAVPPMRAIGQQYRESPQAAPARRPGSRSAW